MEHDIEPKNIGLDRRKQAKYYLGFDFNINKKTDKIELAAAYRKQVEKIMDCGDFSSPQKQIKSMKNEYMDTMDTNWKYNLPKRSLQNSQFLRDGEHEPPQPNEHYRATCVVEQQQVMATLEADLGRVMHTEGNDNWD